MDNLGVGGRPALISAGQPRPTQSLDSPPWLCPRHSSATIPRSRAWGGVLTPPPRAPPPSPPSPPHPPHPPASHANLDPVHVNEGACLQRGGGPTQTVSVRRQPANDGRRPRLGLLLLESHTSRKSSRKKQNTRNAKSL